MGLDNVYTCNTCLPMLKSRKSIMKTNQDNKTKTEGITWTLKLKRQGSSPGKLDNFWYVCINFDMIP